MIKYRREWRFMKKNHFIVGGLLMLLAASLLLGVKYINQDSGKKNKNAVKESTAPKKQTATAEAGESEDATLFIANLSVAWSPGTPMEGWFIEHIKERFGIDVRQAEYPVTPGIFEGCEEGVELCWLQSSVSYYDAVKAGKLRNLEDEIKKHPKAYRRYRKVIKKMKADTYKNTGKKGVFGIPAWLSSFDEMEREGYCVVVPVNAPHPELALELLAYSASDEGIMDIAFGPKGQMWKEENGKYVLLQDWRQVKDENPGKKFVKTKSRMEDWQTAICKLELVGNESLGRELLKMSSGKVKKTQ